VLVLVASFVVMLGCDDGTTEPDAGGVIDDGVAPPTCTFDPGAPEEIPEPEVFTPRWAFEPWISKDISDRDDSYAFVDGFIERDIPVGVLVIDSPWDEQYTTFTPNPSRYPDFGGMVDDMHSRDVRVVMWVTQMVNRRSFDAEPGGDSYAGPAPNFAEGCACGFLVQDCETYDWWKGQGAGVDFFGDGARAWWHRQQDPLLDMGIDGWKLDFGESYMEEDAMLLTAAGLVSHQEYSEAYYRDYLAYGRFRRGREFVTMVRPWDVSYDRRARFHARPEHTPVGWVGDNHRDWSGLVDALDHVFRSANRGYVVLGSDIGGYLDRDQNMLTVEIPFDIEVFQRWVALGAMMPFMELHGRQNLAPWTVPERVDETVDLYRYWATLHHEMVGFWFSLTEEAYASGGPILHPVSDVWDDDFRYVIGEQLLVAPILAPGDARDVALPAGARWYDWWDPSRDAIDGGVTLAGVDVSERRRIPIFVREGAIVPVDVESAVSGLGTAASAGHLTVLVWPSAEETRFDLHEEDDVVTQINALRDSDGSVRVTLSRARRPVIVRLRMDTAPAVARVDGVDFVVHADRAAFDAATSGVFFDGASRWLWMKVEAGAAAVVLEAKP
jgi:alpha-glucosidase (family GH31 glycosyl hydrolase)